MGVKRFDFIAAGHGEGWIEEASLGKYVLSSDYDAAESLANTLKIALRQVWTAVGMPVSRQEKFLDDIEEVRRG